MQQLRRMTFGLAALLLAQGAMAACDTAVPLAAQDTTQVDLMSDALALLKAEQRRALPRLWQSALREQRSELTAQWLNRQPLGGSSATSRASP